MKSRNIPTVIRLVYALIIGAVLITAILVIDTARRFSEAQSEWETYNTEAVSKGFHLAQIRRAFGFGGLIHNFKNLVLRQDIALADSVAEDFISAHNALVGFRDLSDDPEEHEALGHIGDTLESYVSKVGVVTKLISQGKTPQEIDNLVRVDDTPALAALRLLERNWLQASVRAGESSAVVLSEAEREIGLALGTIIAALAIGIILLVTARREAVIKDRLSAALRASEERLTKAHRIAQLSHWELDAATWRIKTFGERFSKLGLEADNTEPAFEDLLSALHPEDRERVREGFKESVAKGIRHDQTYRVLGPDGDITHSHAIGEILRDDAGNVTGMRGTTQDVTQQTRFQETLRESEDRLVRAHRMARIGHWNYDAATQKIAVYGDLFSNFNFGSDATEFSIENSLQPVHPEDIEHVRSSFMQSVSEGTPYDESYRIIGPDGEIYHIHVIGEMVRDSAGAIVAMRGMTQDITARKETEAALRKTQDKLSAAQRIAGIGSWELNSTRLVSVWSEEMYRIFDLDPEVEKPLALDTFYAYVHPEDADKLEAASQRTIDNGEPMTLEYRIVTKLGNEKTVLTFGEGEFAEDGSLITFAGTLQDVTPLRDAEKKLRQAQKMESVGQLSAGVAHDFNNMLAVVLGNLELLSERLADDPESHNMLNTALSAGERGAELTRRLLAYSKRQTLFPEVVDLGPVLADILLLVERTIGREITISFMVHEDVNPVHVDRSQLEAALVNLAVNARDAMPEGGTLTVECTNVTVDEAFVAKNPDATPGDYVTLTVSDTGFGMDAETLEKALEPFFTTKEVGKGSGLGLSMVYGFTEQSGGHLEMRSAPGAGTEIKLYVPASKIAKTTVQKNNPISQDQPGAGHTVLVVDDDEAVRKVTAKQVHSLGYEVVSAASAKEALSVLNSSPGIALMLTDIVLGSDMNGVALALEAKRTHPHLKVLCMSGHAESEIFERYKGANQLRLLPKPFSRSRLSEEIERSLSSDQYMDAG